jgi:hypothetical protein
MINNMSSYFANFLSRVSTSRTGGDNEEDGGATATPTSKTSLSLSSSSSSSWSRWTSPKTFLSQVVAQALSEFFVISDPTQQIQSKLLLVGSGSSSSSSQIVLYDLQLRPQCIVAANANSHAALVYQGTVQQVEFSWVWGGNEQTSFIREVVLLVRGVSVQILQKKNGKEVEEEIMCPSMSSGGEEQQEEVVEDNTKQQAPSYLERYVQQIMDHLTLKIEDLKVRLNVESNTVFSSKEQQQQYQEEQVVVKLQSLCLLSMGKQIQGQDAEPNTHPLDTTVLSQRISVDRFAVDIVVTIVNDDTTSEKSQNDNNNTVIVILPLLEPFGYAADVTRTQGRRFQDGFLHGLEVKGHVFYDSSSFSSSSSSATKAETDTSQQDGRWTLRLGPQQARTVGKCLEMMAAFQPTKGAFSVVEQTIATHPVDNQQQSFAAISDNATQSSENIGDAVINTSTLLVLPLPALSFVFDTDDDDDCKVGASRIDFPDCTFSCRLDGSLCQVQGEGTITVNDTCPLLQLPNGAMWILDCVAKSLEVQKQHQEQQRQQQVVNDNANASIVAQLNLEADHVRRLVGSALGVAKAMQESAPSLDTQELWKDMEEAVVEEWQAWQKQNQTTLFSFSLMGMVSLRLSTQQGWMDASLLPSNVAIRANGTIHTLRMGEMRLGPTSFGEADLKIPDGVYDAISNEFCLHGDISATLGSLDIGRNLGNIILEFVSIFVSPSGTDSLPTLDDVPKVELPFVIRIPGIQAAMKSPATNVVLATLTVATNGTIVISSLNANVDGTASMTIGEMKCSLNEKLLSIGSVSQCRMDDYFELCSPLLNTKLTLTHSRLVMKVEYLHILPLYQEETTQKTPRETDVLLPWPIHLEMDRLRIDPSTILPFAIRAKSIDLHLKSTSTQTLYLGLQKELMFQLDKDEDYIRLAVGNTEAEMSPATPSLVTFFRGTNLRLLASSFGTTSVIVPLVTLENGQISVPKLMKVEMESLAVVQNLANFARNAFGQSAQDVSSVQGRPSSFNPLAFQLSAVAFQMKEPSARAMLTAIKTTGSNIQVSQASYEDDDGMTVSASGLVLSFGNAISGTFQTIDRVSIPNVASIQPLSDVSFKYDFASLKLELGDVVAQLPATRQSNPESLKTNPLLLPISVSMTSAKVRVGLTCFDLTMGRIAVTAVPEGELIQLVSRSQLCLTVAHTATGKQVEAAIGAPNGEESRLAINMLTFRIAGLDCSCPQAGTNSFGNIVASAPALSFEPSTSTVVVNGEANAYVEFIEEAQNMWTFCQPLMDYFRDPDSTDQGYSFMVPKATLMTEVPSSARLCVEDLFFDGSNAIQVERMQIVEKGNGMSATVSGVSCTVTPTAATISLVESLNVPGSFYLKDPTHQVQCWYNNARNELSIAIPNVQIAVTPSLSPASLSSDNVPSPIELPCNFTCSIDDLLVLTTDTCDVPTSVQKIFATAKTPPEDPFHPLQKRANTAMLGVSFARMANSMLVLNQGQLNAMMIDSSGQVFQSLRFQAKDGMATAGFSSVDWDSVFFGKGACNQPDPIVRLPFARVEALELGLQYHGVVVGTQTRIMIPVFVGTEMATSEDIIRHFKSAILRRAPAFLAKANVLGSNLGDTAASTAGIVALGAGSSIASASGAGVAGILAYDGVVGAIKSGKAARGVSVHEKYQFGDIVSEANIARPFGGI